MEGFTPVGRRKGACGRGASSGYQRKINRKQAEKIKEFYPIYSDVPHAWQADLLKIPYNKATSKESVRLHHFLVLININTKFCFVEHLLFKGKTKDDDYKPGKKAPIGLKWKGNKLPKNWRWVL
jgi:hypothetical protein